MRSLRLLIVGAFCLQVVFAAPRQISTLSGEAYMEVTVTRRDATGVGFTHRDGVAFVDFSNMSEATKKEFGFNQAGYELAVAEKQKKELALAEKQRIEAETAVAVAEQKRIAEQAQLDAAKRSREAAMLTASVATAPAVKTIATRDYSARDYSAPRVEPISAGGRCAATTKKGMQCKRDASGGGKYCWQHGG